MSEVSVSIVVAVLALLIGVVGNLLSDNVQHYLRRLFRLPQKKREETYSERVSRLTESLSRASADVDEVLKEIAIVSRERTEMIVSLERHLEELATREKQVRERIDVLEKVPLAALQHFERILDKGDRRSAWRDYMLFGPGVVVSTVIAIILNLLGF